MPDDVWYQCQILDLETSGIREGPASMSTFALTNVVCLRCGYSMHGYTVSKYKVDRAGETRKYRYRKYRCTGRSNAHACDAPMILAEYLERLVIGEVAGYIQANEGEVQRLYEEAAQLLGSYHEELTRGIADLDAQIAAQVAERSRLVTAVADLVSRRASDELIGQMDIAVQKCSEEVHIAEARKALAQGALKKLPGAKLRMDAFRAGLEGMAERLQSADLRVQKRLLADLVDRIEVDPDHKTVQVYVKRFGLGEDPLASDFT